MTNSDKNKFIYVLYEQFEQKYKNDYFKNEAEKRLRRELEILTGSDKHVAIEVLAKIYEVANKNTGHVFAFHAMNSLVLIPYLIGVSQYNPYGPEYVFEDVDVPNMHDNDMIINTSQAGFDCIYNQLSTDFYGRIMYIYVQ